MSPFFFSINKTYSSAFSPTMDKGQLSAAYQDENYLVVVPVSNWGSSQGIFYQSPLNGTVEEHLESVFLASNITQSMLNVGHCIRGIWRPGRRPSDNISTVEGTSQQLLSDKQFLLYLVEKLKDIFLTVEPSSNMLNVHGTKIRELHLLACMEVENVFRYYEKQARPDLSEAKTKNLKMTDFVKLKPYLVLDEYSLIFHQYSDLGTISPFKEWDKNCATKSLPWYESYNASKHNRQANSYRSDLNSCINAVVANIIMFCSRYGTYSLENTKGGTLPYNLTLGIGSCDTWYIPRVKRLADTQQPLVSFVDEKNYADWTELCLSDVYNN